jgi:hypothetical protein
MRTALPCRPPFPGAQGQRDASAKAQPRETRSSTLAPMNVELGSPTSPTLLQHGRARRARTFRLGVRGSSRTENWLCEGARRGERALMRLGASLVNIPILRRAGLPARTRKAAQRRARKWRGYAPRLVLPSPPILSHSAPASPRSTGRRLAPPYEHSCRLTFKRSSRRSFHPRSHISQISNPSRVVVSISRERLFGETDPFWWRGLQGAEFAQKAAEGCRGKGL